MFTQTPLATLLSAAALVSTASAALDPIVIKGSKFFYKTNGTQFYIKGVAYQQGVGAGGSSTSSSTSSTTGYTDPLADVASCTRDIPYLKRLGTNVIRTYAIDPTADHSQCMAMLDAAGIYVISDLSEPNTSINRANPSWNTALYTRYASVIDSLHNYTNVIGFFAGNEVPNSATTTNSTAYVKAAVRDMKNYISTQGYRAMGVGYAADDDATVVLNVANYLNCGDSSTAIDFWGYNIYEWCGSTPTFQSSGYAARTAEFQNYSVPAFFAEYGCNTPTGGAAARPFNEIQALYGPDMNNVFSGGIVYEYFEETNDYGLVSVSGTSVSTLADFNALQTQIASIATIATGVNSASYTPTNTAARSCPTVSTNWQSANSPELPPTPNQELCSCMVSSLTCKLKSSVATTSYGTLFGQVCGYNSGKACVGIAASPSTGSYGAYSMCSSAEQLAFVFDAYYQSQNKAATACDFGGAASVGVASTASSCSAILKQAASGTGTVTSFPTASAGSVGTASAGSSGTAAASSSKAAAAGVFVQHYKVAGGALAMGAYLVAAIGVGAAMVVL